MNLADYMTQHGIKPFSESSLCSSVDVSKRHLGYIAKGVKRPSPELAMRIEDATDGQVTMREMFEFYERKQAELREPSEPLPCSEPADTTGEQITLDLEQGAA